MHNLEVKAAKEVKRMVAAKVEGHKLEDERKRQLAGLFEAEDVSDEKAIRRQKELIHSIDDRILSAKERVKHYRKKSENACHAIIEDRMKSWETEGRKAHRQRVQTAEMAAGEHLGKAVTILEQLGPDHSGLFGQIRRSMTPADPTRRPLAFGMVKKGFEVGVAAGPGEHVIDREEAIQLGQLRDTATAARRMLAGMIRKQRAAVGYDPSPAYLKARGV